MPPTPLRSLLARNLSRKRVHPANVAPRHRPQSRIALESFCKVLATYQASHALVQRLLDQASRPGNRLNLLVGQPIPLLQILRVVIAQPDLAIAVLPRERL